MSLWKDRRDKLVRALRDARPTDTLGAAATVIGIILVVSGIVLQKDHGVALGATVRTLGGALLLGGVGAVLFGESRRRAAIIAVARRIAERYMAATAHWRWTSRWGLAGVATGLILLVPALAMEIIFGSYGAAFIATGFLIFGGGVNLLVFGVFYRRGAARKPPQSSEEGRGRMLGNRRGHPSASRATPRPKGRSLRGAGLHKSAPATPRPEGRSTVGGKRRGAARKPPKLS